LDSALDLRKVEIDSEAKSKEVASSEAILNRIDMGSRDSKAHERMPTRLSTLEPARYATIHVNAEKRHPCILNAPISEKPKDPSRKMNRAVISLDSGGCAALALKTERSPIDKP